jgi:hypothetical protein
MIEPGIHSTPGHQIAAKGWASPLAMLVTLLLLIESGTGLWIYLAPFGITSQIQVLVHVSAGLLLVLPYLVYQYRHFLTWYAQKATAVMVLGYFLMVLMLVSLASGLV